MSTAAASDQPSVLVRPQDAPFAQRLAAQEIRRYVYHRCGVLLPITDQLPAAPTAHCIVVASKEQPVIQHLLGDTKWADSVQQLAAEEYRLVTIAKSKTTLVVGGDPIGTLYGAYRLAERLGVRFYLHGDVIPDEPTAWALPSLDEVGKPLFRRRGIQPFHDFPEGPDWWNEDDYQAVLAQLPKLRMNFFGLHTYPEGGVGPEPVVWIGQAADQKPDGQVTFSYPARHFVTRNYPSPGGGPPPWGYRSMKTSQYVLGAAAMFPRDNFGADYMRGLSPWTEMTPRQSNLLFQRMAEMLDHVFTFAQQLGIKTCIGIETPLVIPTAVRERLKSEGKDPSDPTVVQQVYEGMFRRIMNSHPLDYYWLWTPEGWTWQAVNEKQVDATLADLRLAVAAAKKVGVPFKLATCGWVLGPPQDPALFDRVLPKEMPISCINRQVGHAPVEVGFAKVQGRPQWAIPWLEDDPALTSPQLWVGRMRKDAADALAYGCSGLMGIHWRTRILGPNVAALAHAAWDQSGWNASADESRPARPAADSAADKQRFLPTADFYADWARSQFGEQAAKPLAALFEKIDGHLPRPSDWVGGPGGIKPDPRPWKSVRGEYAFVDEMAALQSLVQGPGNLQRYHYWLSSFRYMRAVARVNCTLARRNKAASQMLAEKRPDAQRQLARRTVLPIRKQLVRAIAEAHHHLLATVNTHGGMGNVANWQQHIMPNVLDDPGRQLAKVLGEALPAEAVPSANDERPWRMFMPTTRTCLVQGQRLTIEVVVLGALPRRLVVYWRPLGPGPMVDLPMQHVARGVYRVTLPARATAADLEYYVEAQTSARSPDGGESAVRHVLPATAPRLNQSVVVVAP